MSSKSLDLNASLFRCSYKECTCKHYTVGVGAIGLSVEEFTSHSSHHLQQCVLCRHALMWHAEANTALRSSKVALSVFIDPNSDSLPVTSPRSVASPRLCARSSTPSRTASFGRSTTSSAEAMSPLLMPFVQTSSDRRFAIHTSPPTSGRRAYACTFGGCSCLRYSLGRTVSGMSNSELLASGISVQLCVECSHGMSHHNIAEDIRKGEVNVQSLVIDHIGFIPPSNSICRNISSFSDIRFASELRCKCDGCQCSGYRISASTAEQSVEKFLALAPFIQQCVRCHHALAWHPHVIKSLQAGTLKLHSLVDNNLSFTKLVPSASLASCGSQAEQSSPMSSRQHAVDSARISQADSRPRTPRSPMGSARDPPPDMLCPITHELMVEPVILTDGHSYELNAIQEWLVKHDVSPMTGQPLPNKHVIPNYTLKKLIDSWIDSL